MREAATSGSTTTRKHRVVAHFKTGRLLKGYTGDFAASSDVFSLISEQHRDEGKVYQVKIDDLKAVFFVRCLKGNPFYRERKKFKEVDTSHLKGLRIQLQFKDGEVIRGTTLDYNQGKKGFFVSPVDPSSNNLSIFVINDALHDVKIASDVVE